MNACLPGCVWNATPRSLSPLERNIGYNGDLTSREAGSVGGQMVKKMIEAYEQNLTN